MLALIRLAVLVILFAVLNIRSAEAQALVDVGWVKERLGNSGVVLVDLRSNTGLTRAGFERAHIPGSVYSDYGRDGWRVKRADGVRGVLAPVAKLEALIGRLGIDNGTHVVLVAGGWSAADMGAATRVYWTFKVLGHDKVSVLDGGFAAWVKARDKTTKAPLNRLASGPVRPAPKVFKASLRSDMLIARKDVAAAIKGKVPLIDNRSSAYFMGLSKSGAAKAAGTLPGARNLPNDWLTVNGRGVFRNKTEITRIYKARGLPTSGKQITFCNTGHLASVGWFVSSEILGNKNALLYDGSMADWTSSGKLPVERKIK